MLKILVCLLSVLILAVVVLQLRQQRLELNHQANQIHDRIEAQQAKLWSQQLQIAVYTAPNAISHTVKAQELHMVPQAAPASAERRSDSESATNPDAE